MQNIKNILQDIIYNLSGLDTIDAIKVNGSTDATSIIASATDRSVIVFGKLKTAVPEFVGTFGMPNLSKLQTILKFDEYNVDSKITVKMEERDGTQIPTVIHFENATGDFINDYRLMSKAVVDERIKSVSFKGTSWDIQIVPSAQNVQRMKKQTQANNEEKTFKANVVDGNLRFYFGDQATHSGNFTFESDVAGHIDNKWHWPIKQFTTILSLASEKTTLKFSNQGVAEITVDSGYADYQFLIPGQTK